MIDMDESCRHRNLYLLLRIHYDLETELYNIYHWYPVLQFCLRFDTANI